MLYSKHNKKLFIFTSAAIVTSTVAQSAQRLAFAFLSLTTRQARAMDMALTSAK